LRRALPRWWCQNPPRNYFFHRQADSHYASNLNHKLSTVMRIEDKEKPAYLLGYAYVANTAAPNVFVSLRLISFSFRHRITLRHCRISVGMPQMHRWCDSFMLEMWRRPWRHGAQLRSLVFLWLSWQQEERDSNGKVKSTKWSCCLVPLFSHHEFALTVVFSMKWLENWYWM
jgi:hypothetical protein